MKQTFYAMLLVATGVGRVIGAEPEFRVATETLSPDLPYQAERSAPVNYHVDFSVVVTAPYHCDVLKVWLPVPTSDVGQAVSNSRLSTFPMEVEPSVASEPLYGNRFAYFEFHKPQGAQIVRHQFDIQVWELDWNIDPEQLQTMETWPESFTKYQRGETQAVVVDDRFREVLDEILPTRSTAGKDFGRVMQWVEANFKYDHRHASLGASSEHGLTERRGHCSDYHGFCASMGRALGVPTRVTYGISPFPKNSPSHCKLEAFLVPYGWVSFDVSETQKLIEDIKTSHSIEPSKRDELIAKAQQRLERGFRDNTWFLQTRGTDYDLIPPASKRVAVVRTAYIEADGVALPEPDPADAERTTFSWMTVHKYSADKQVSYPFKDWKTLQ